MKKLFLGGVTPCDKLDIVNKQDVHIAVFVAELDIAVGLNGGNQLNSEGFAGDVFQPRLGALLQNIMANRVH